MEFSEILWEVDGGVATVTLNRPETRNAITGEAMIADIEAACAAVNADPAIKVMILTAADPAFSSGGNVKDMQDGKEMFGGTPAELRENYKRFIHRIPKAVTGVAVPTIAAVNGAAVGAGCDLTLMCDMRVASEKAKFTESFINLGIIPGDGGAFFLPKLVGMARACEMTFTGKVVKAPEALEMGLVNYVVPHDRLLAKTRELADEIAAKPAHALRMAKQLLYMGQRVALPDLLDQSAAFQALCHSTEEHKALVREMVEKTSKK
jgi:enoyl-CoA hydratase/carnithine racemase